MKKGSFNAIIAKDKDSDSLVFVSFDKGVIDGTYYKINLEDVWPDSIGEIAANTMILSRVKIKDEKDMSILPKFSVQIEFKGKPMNFWHIMENPAHLQYFLSNLQKKDLKPIDTPA